jgi:AraC-like DNA-binding protein
VPSVLDLAVESLDQPVVTHEPDTAASVVVCLPSGAAAVVGPRVTATYAPGSPATRLRLRLAPGHTALSVPAAKLVGRTVPLGQLWGDGSGSAEAVAGVLTRLVTQQLAAPHRREPTGYDVVHRATRLLARYGVRATADRLHVSERHLRTLFTDVVGLPPKTYARIERVRSVLDRISERDFARLAAELGYYDQSHLTNEFRAVMGIPPAAFAGGQRLPPTPCAAVTHGSAVIRN